MGQRLCDWKQQRREGKKKRERKTEERKKRQSDQCLQADRIVSLKSQQSFKGIVQC